jgi:hypothetical protein
MAAPTKVKTWVKYSHYVVEADAPTPQVGQTADRSAARYIMHCIKTQWLAMGGTVERSCGYYDAGGGAAWHYGAADHWPDAASVRWKEADNKFGWIVLKNTNMHSGGNGFQVLLALTRDRTLTYYMTMAVSLEAGFTGGSETTRPTATDEVLVYNDEAWYSTSGAGYPQCPIPLNIWYANDGTSFRVWGVGASEMYRTMNPWMFDKLTDAPTWLDKPVVFGVMWWRRTDMMSFVAPNSRRMFFCCDDVRAIQTMMAVESIYSSGPLTQHAACQVPDMGGSWPVFPVSVISIHPSVAGYIGRLVDFWAVPDALASGDYMPGDGSMAMAVVQNVLQGNDGTSVMIP